ncbi:sensor histidine kinase [Ekhidna sp.]
MILDELNDPIDQIDSINLLTSSLFKSDPSLAKTLAEKALEISLKESYSNGEAEAHYYLGTLSAYDKNDVALYHLQKCYKIAKELDKQVLQANALLSLSAVYHGMDHLVKAIESCKLAKKIGLALGNQKILSRVHTNLATFYYYQDEITNALQHSRAALQLKIELKDDYGTRLNYLNLGVILCEFDSTLDEGISYLKRARLLSTNDPIMVNDIVSNMIWAYSRKKQYEISISYLDSAIWGNDTIENKYTLQSIHRMGKEVYLKLADFENAYNHLNQETKVQNELKSAEIESKFKILDLENSNIEKQEKILLLEKKRLMANLKFQYAIGCAVLFLVLFIVMYRNFKAKEQLLKNLEFKRREIEEKSNLLEVKNKEIEQFAYVASHDLKAPLHTIISCINVLNEEIESKLSANARQMASFMETSVSRMRTMIDTLLEHGKLGADIKFEEVDLNELIRNLQADLSILIAESKAKVVVNYLPSVIGSRTELSLLFQNLITNAIKFSSVDQTPIITISYRSLQEEQKLQISIRDNGVGIPHKRQERVFKLFERAHGKQYEGSGIGLAHCQKIIKLHNGNIWLESTEGIGTTFHFTLPFFYKAKQINPLNIKKVLKRTG